MINIVGHDVSFLSKGVGLYSFALKITSFGFWGDDINRGIKDSLGMDNSGLFFLYF